MRLTVVTRASEEEAEEKLRRAGADTVFAPFGMVGQRLAKALLRPYVATFLDSATMAMGLDVSEPGSFPDSGGHRFGTGLIPGQWWPPFPSSRSR